MSHVFVISSHNGAIRFRRLKKARLYEGSKRKVDCRILQKKIRLLFRVPDDYYVKEILFT